MTEILDIDPTSAAFRNNAIEHYRQLLREHPVAPLSGGRYLICGHRDVAWALKDHEAVVRPTTWSSERKPPGPFREFGINNMISMNPPDHTRFRKAIMRAFTPRRVQALEGFIGRTCDRLIDTMLERGAGDFIDDFAYPLPAMVICEMLGIPEADHHLLRNGSGAMLAGLELSATPEEFEQAAVAAQALFDYLLAFADSRASRLGDDLLSLLIRHEMEDQLSRTEVVWAAITLLMAGHETTTHLLGNGLLALMRNPDQYSLLLDRPELASNAVEEFLRFDPSIYVLFRQAARDISLGDQTLPEGTLMILSLAAANRDPALFDEPDALDITRGNASANLAFAAGRHLCAGHAVARLEAKIAFERLTARVGGFELAGAPVPREGLMFKGYHRLPVNYLRPA